MTVAKLKGARDRKRRTMGKCEGRKSYAERDAELVALAREIKASGGHVSLRAVAAELAAQGRVTPSGNHYSASGGRFHAGILVRGARTAPQPRTASRCHAGSQVASIGAPRMSDTEWKPGGNS